MFKSISIKNGIKHHNKTYFFKPGITTITGPNESGKSLLAEFLAFSLFGVTALRLSSENYKGLEVTTEVDINGKGYVIQRGLTNCKIFLTEDYTNQRSLTDPKLPRTEETICVGTKPCNSFITQKLGYNYNVYAMGNYAAQEQLSDFGRMKPAERKKAVDQVLGLGVIDKLISDCGEEASRYRAEAAGIMTVSTPPSLPERPEGYVPLDQVNMVYNLLKDKKEALLIHDSMLNLPIKEAPIRPEETIKETSLELHTKLMRKNTLSMSINNIKSLELPSLTLKQIEEAEALNRLWAVHEEYLYNLERLPKVKPELSSEQVTEGLLKWEEYEHYLSHSKNQIECPKCQHKFLTSGETLTPVVKPEVSKEYYIEQRNIIFLWQGAYIPDEIPAPKEDKVDPVYLINQRSLLVNIERKEELPELEKELSTLENIQPEQLQIRQSYERALDLYNADLGVYLRNMEDRKIAQDGKDKILTEFPNLLRDFEAIELLRPRVMIYENELARYTKDLETYNSQLQLVTKYTEKAEAYKLASNNLKEMKVKVKRYVIPSLKKVASRLLTEMSGGTHNSIEIDEDFNISVDGLEMRGGSGSGQAIANIALRIGLGQVLTHKSFNVFIGDEMDGSMDEERVNQTADCLKRLSKFINQIILVTHKDIVADHYIKL